MDIAISVLAVTSGLLVVAGIMRVLFPLVVASIRAVIRRDPGGAFVPHSELMRSRAVGVLYVGLAILYVIGYQPQPFRRESTVPATAAGRPETQERITRLVSPEIQSGNVIGLVVGVVDPSGTQVFGFGHRRLGAPPPDGQTIFEIGDVSRTFTTLLLERMAERRQVSLTQPLRDLLPDSVSVPTWHDQTITLEQLATDRSGLPPTPPNRSRSPLEWCPPYDDPYAGYREKLLHRFLSGYDLTRPPGSRIEPSTLGIGLLAHALTRVARARFDTLVTSEITDRLGMSDTRVAPSPAAADRMAAGYVVGRWGYGRWRLASPAHRWNYGALTGAGGLGSTANDLLAYLQAQLGLKSSDLAFAMEETRRPRYRGRGLEAVGRGWSVRLPSPAGESVGAVTWCHGGTGGMRSWIGMDEARRVGVVVLANSSMDVDALGFDLLRAMR